MQCTRDIQGGRALPLRTAEWFERQSPSVKDGMYPKKEKTLLWELCDIIMGAAELLKLPTNEAVVSAMVLSRKFYMVKSLKRNDHVVISAAAMLLANKLQNCPRAVPAVAQAFIEVIKNRLRTPHFSSELATFAREYKEAQHTGARAVEVFIDKFGERIRTAEVALTCAVGFHSLHTLGEEFPWFTDVASRNRLEKHKSWKVMRPGTNKLNEEKSAYQRGWSFLNDCARYSHAHLIHNPQAIVLAAVRFAMQTHKIVWNKTGKDGNKTDIVEHECTRMQTMAGKKDGQGRTIKAVTIEEVDACIAKVLADTKDGLAWRNEQEAVQKSMHQSINRPSPLIHCATPVHHAPPSAVKPAAHPDPPCPEPARTLAPVQHSHEQVSVVSRVNAGEQAAERAAGAAQPSLSKGEKSEGEISEGEIVSPEMDCAHAAASANAQSSAGAPGDRAATRDGGLSPGPRKRLSEPGPGLMEPGIQAKRTRV